MAQNQRRIPLFVTGGRTVILPTGISEKTYHINTPIANHSGRICLSERILSARIKGKNLDPVKSFVYSDTFTLIAVISVYFDALEAIESYF